MPTFRRYAIYFAPEPGPLADFGASWLGWDAVAGAPRPHPELPGLPRPASELTATPRKYGLHATLKPPFRIAETSDAGALEADLAALANTLAPASAEGLEVSRIGRFLALTLRGDPTGIAHVAGEAVRRLDHHRAPPTDVELARRQKARLSAKQQGYLETWGYPYVFDAFRFHITLSGPLPDDMVEPVRMTLQTAFAPHLPAPFHLRELCLFGENDKGRFHLVSRHDLTG
ncbi:DUF1045 domain-containing protein [Aquicoccus sp.]|uniref:DUF1045 domain-containing protein n=1 Tax=Aquicoccus sp. TaxID=2055851 RepID=UPI00356619A9